VKDLLCLCYRAFGDTSVDGFLKELKDMLCLCYSAFGDTSVDGFLKELKDMFFALGRFLTIESDVIMPTQVCSRLSLFLHAGCRFLLFM